MRSRHMHSLIHTDRVHSRALCACTMKLKAKVVVQSASEREGESERDGATECDRWRVSGKQKEHIDVSYPILFFFNTKLRQLLCGSV